MRFLSAVAAGLILFPLARRWFKQPEEKLPENYIKIDLPPIRVSRSPGISREGILDQFIPEVKSMYIPPGVKLVWPGRISIGPIEIECPVESRTLKLPVRYDKRGVDAVTAAIRKRLYETKVRRLNGQWEIDFPEITIPLGG